MEEVILRTDEDVYPASAVLNACYVFLDRAYLYLERRKGPRRGFMVRIRPRLRGGGRSGLKALTGEFCNELGNAALRHFLTRDNRRIREFIVGSALFSCSSASVQGSFAGAEAGLGDDPLGIAIPWEKRRGKKKKKHSA